MYRRLLPIYENQSRNRVLDLDNGGYIPFDPANTDYQTFKREVAAGTPLEDPDGNIMSQEQVDAFLATIP